MDKALKYRIVVWCIVVFLLIFLPQAVTNPSQLQTTAIVSGLGIDKSKKGLELSVQIIVPQPSTSYSPKNIVASGEGNNIMEAITAIELKVGQVLGLAHCYVIILGDEFCSNKIPSELDYLMRSNIMGNNSVLVHTSGKAKDLLEISSKLSEGDVSNLQNIAKYNKENYTSSNTSLIELFNQYLSPSKCSLIGTIDTEKKSSTSGGQSGSSQSDVQSMPSSSGQSSSSNGETPSIFKNEGSAIVVKDGKKLLSLTNEEIIKINWLDPGAQKGVVKIENFTNEILTETEISLEEISKKLNFKPKIVNNSPVLEVDIHLESRVETIKNKDGEIYTSHKNYYTPSLIEAINNKIKQDVADALELLKEYNFDIWNIYNIFNNANHTKWKEYLNTLENKDNYIQKLEIITNVFTENKE